MIIKNLSRLNFATRFLKELTEGALTTSSGREFQTVQILLQKKKTKHISATQLLEKSKIMPPCVIWPSFKVHIQTSIVITMNNFKTRTQIANQAMMLQSVNFQLF